MKVTRTTLSPRSMLPQALLLSLLACCWLALGMVHAQGSNNFGCIRSGTWDVGCLVRASQYTVLADVVSTDLNGTSSTNPDATQTNYTAVLNVVCAWSSFSTPPSTSVNLVGRRIPLMNLGYPHPLCKNERMGNTATTGKRQLFFLYVSSNSTEPVTRYSSTSMCAGEFAGTQANKDIIATILSTAPANRMANMGSNAECALSIKGGGGGNGGGDDVTPDPNGARRLGAQGWWVGLAILPLLLQFVM